MNPSIPDPASAIAIIGLACRLPGARNAAAFWHNLVNSVESITFFQDNELEKLIIHPAELNDPHYVKAKAVLEDIESFDAAFFGFSPREASLTDPQHRLFLECVWESLEHTGYNPENYPGLIGLFAGAGANTYLLYNIARSGYLTSSAGSFQALNHNKNDHLATRTAYKLNLHGPAVTVQTACSTSLVAVHLACQSLLNFQTDICLAGGVTISHPQNSGYLYHEQGIGSPDGHCRPFDEQAAGTVAGSGAGVVVLKRYEEALADGDPILAVILGSAINNDGAQKVGYTAPSADLQADVIETAIGLAGISADTISYVEAHGTGTLLGDPIEIAGLTRAFRASSSGRNFCALGAVKGNIGHLDTAAGVVGLIKTVLALQHQVIPPTLHFQRPNPQLNLDESPFFINREPLAWQPANNTPRRAGVSSFGIGGTNAHVVVQEAPLRPSSGPGRGWHLVTVSAASDAALEQSCTDLSVHLVDHPNEPLSDVAYTRLIGRKALKHRRFLVTQSREEAAALLTTLAPERVFSREQEPIHRPITFMFPGQGAQHPNMGTELYGSEPVFRQEVDRCLELLAPHLDVDLRPLLYPPPGGEEAAAVQLQQTHLTQPVLFVIEYALAQLWRSWGLEPESMIGHSIGEYVAACLSGVFSLEDALALVALRGKLIQGLAPGAMLSVPLAAADLQPYLNDNLSLAATNGPALCAVSGPAAAIDTLESRLSQERIACQRLHTSHAFHSAMMNPIVAHFVAAIRQIRLHPPQIPYLSNVTGEWITAEQAMDPHYWGQHIRQTVRFAEGLSLLLQNPDRILLEVGPGRTLRTLVRWHPDKKPNQFMLASLPHPQDNQSDTFTILNTIGHLWLTGVALDWAAFYAHEKRQRLPLPTYPFQRQKYWIDLLPDNAAASLPLEDGLRKKEHLADWFYTPLWQEFPQPLPLPIPEKIKEQTWLLFAEKGGFSGRFADYLHVYQPNLITVLPGKTFSQINATTYQLSPGSRTQYAELIQALQANDQLPNTLLHAWNMTHGTACAEEMLERGFYSLLYLAQAFGSQQITHPMQWLVLAATQTEQANTVLLEPEKAAALGPCQVIPREYRHIRCRHIEVTLPQAGSWLDNKLQQQLLAEIILDNAPARVAYHKGSRRVQEYTNVHLAPIAGEAIPLQSGGVYLITGGLGGLGLAFADYLARQAAAKLVLIGRSAFPPRATWNDWLAAHQTVDPTSETIRHLQAIEACGGQVLVIQADVTDATQMRQAIQEAEATLGPIQGVIHAAGVPTGGVIQLKTPETATTVLAAKVQGTSVLGDIFANTRLDFMVLCSSLTSVIGRFGQVDYTAANAFLDAYAAWFQAQTGTYTVAINWDAWEEIGMAASTLSPSKSATKPSDKPVVRTLNHPLLDRCLLDSEEQKIFATDFNVARHWVLDEHRILGHPIIPGVTYFEMVRAALAPEANGKIFDFRDMIFLNPLRVRDGETREVRLILTKNDDGYDFAVRSQEGGQEQTYNVGKVALRAAAPLQQYDLDDLRGRCNQQELLLPAESREEDLGPRWHNVQRVYLGKGEALMELEMPAAFANDFDQIDFHPALQDRTAGIAKDFLAPHNHYLPFTYQHLQIKGKLPPKIYSYARYHDGLHHDGETITFDMVLMDEQGRGLVEIQRFSQKRVNDPAEQIRAFAQREERAAAPPIMGREGIRPEEGVAALQRILGWRLSPQVVVSVRDLAAALRFSDEMVHERMQEAQQARQRTSDQPKHPRPTLNTPYTAPRNDLERKIAAIWQEMLGVESVGVEDNFFELGGDSLVGIELVSRLSKELDQPISAVSLFEGPTVSALVGLLNPDEDKEAHLDESRRRGALRAQRQQQRTQHKRQ